ncbi:MAG: hypothetical protein ACFNOM_01220 [Parascardovia denticolens]
MDLPEPEGPTIETNSPVRARKSTSRTTGTREGPEPRRKLLLTPLASTIIGFPEASTFPDWILSICAILLFDGIV